MIRRLGNRGAVLFLIGFLWLLMAWTVAQAPLPSSRPPAPHEEIPAHLREGLWAVGGLIAIVFAFFKQGRDKWGFGALMIMPAERALSWLGAVILHFTAPTAYPPLVLSAGQCLVWLTVCLLIYVIARWEERGTVILVPPTRSEDIR